MTIAVRTFKLTYDALPGDMDNAESFWTDTTTQNGNGDGHVGSYATGLTASETSGPTTGAVEFTRAWQHLLLAELLVGDYPGAYIVNAVNNVFPKSSYGTNMIYRITDGGVPNVTSGAASFFMLMLNDKNVDSVGNHWGADAEPKDAYFLDKKYDDAPYPQQVLLEYERVHVIVAIL